MDFERPEPQISLFRIGPVRFLKSTPSRKMSRKVTKTEAEMKLKWSSNELKMRAKNELEKELENERKSAPKG